MTQSTAKRSVFVRFSQAVGCFLLSPVFRWVLIGIGVIGLVATIFAWGYVKSLTRDLPSVKVLAEYAPAVTTRVHAGDGKLIAEFASEHRIYVPYEGMPDHVISAFISAEDKSFFSHSGLDYSGMMRAGIRNLRDVLRGDGGNLQGGSTITQQVAKNMLLEDRSQSYVRKTREAVLAKRMERIFKKEKIIELYLNEIYLGGSSYGVASASLNYFNKSLPDLTIEEAAVLAAMAQRPGDVNPFRKPERSKIRRDWVIGRMEKNGYISKAEEAAAKAEPLETRERLKGAEYAAATYFVEELRRDLTSRVGEEVLNADGLSIRSTLDSQLQLVAQDALRSGLEEYDRRHGYRGPVTAIELGEEQAEALKSIKLPGGYGAREAALVLTATTKEARLLLTDGFEIGLAAADVEWAQTYRREGQGKGLKAGDVIMVSVDRAFQVAEGSEEPNPAGDPVETAATSTEEIAAEPTVNTPIGEARLGQIPEVEGALLALDPHTGRILAMAGGYSFWKSQFNRTTQAKRQPGSSFKPFVYSAAMEMGDVQTGRPAYTPATRILDAPFVQCDYTRVKVEDQCYKPTNYTSGRFYGMSTLRLGLEKSRNAMTVRLANDIGMEQVADFANRIGLYKNLDPYLSMSLGAGEVTVWDMVKSYSALVNGGKQITPSLFDRVQDRSGRTLYRSDERECVDCAEEYTGQTPNLLPDERKQVIDPIIAFQTAYMLQGVIERGTAAGLRRGCSGPEAEAQELCRHAVAGKTGTTNDYFDAWFMGFSPDLVVGIYVGFDEPKTLGNGESGGRVAAPIFGKFMNEALKQFDAIPFRAPSGIRFVDIDSRTGELPNSGSGEIIREAFRKGTEPGSNMSYNDSDWEIFDNGQGGTSGNGQRSSGTGIPDIYGTADPTVTQPGTRQEETVEGDFDSGIY